MLNGNFTSLDPTAVYATHTGGRYSDPLTINFAQAVSGFSIKVVGIEADFFTVTDNLGSSETFDLEGKSQTFMLSDTDITSVTIASKASNHFDFAIDNVSFSPGAVATVPDTGSTLAMLGMAGTLVLLAARWQRRRESGPSAQTLG